MGAARWQPGGVAHGPRIHRLEGGRHGAALLQRPRYYDPALGTFLSPDTIVPDAGAVIDYNRYLYARGNPLRYSDPTGHYIYEDKPDDPFVWYGDKPTKELVRTAEPIYVPTLDQARPQRKTY